MTLATLQLPAIIYKKAKFYTEGRTEPVRAFVNHRMVGTLAGTDAYFNHPDREVSTHFGIGYGTDGIVRISQYVPLDDTAYGAGNYDATGNWDNWGFKTTELNAQLINIEHQDISHDQPKGVVALKIQQASQKLQALIRFGTIAEWKAAGIVIRDWTHNAPIIHKEISAIPVDLRHIIKHNDIAGKLKPYCWSKWEKDLVGFPATAYVGAIKNYGAVLRAAPTPVPVPTPTPTPTATPPVTYTQAQLDEAIMDAVEHATTPLLATNTALQAKLADRLNTDTTIAAILEAQAHVLRTQ